MFVFLSLVFILGACLHALWWPWRRQWKLLGHLPRLPTWPIIGNAHLIWNVDEDVIKTVTDMAALVDQPGQLVSFELGPILLAGAQDPTTIRAVSNACPEKPYFYKMPMNWAGNGLLTASNAIWKHTVKKLSGAFSKNVLDGYQHIFNEQSQELVANLKSEEGKGPFDAMEKYIGKNALGSIFKVTFGERCSLDRQTLEKYYEASSLVNQLYARRGVNPIYHVDFIFHLTPMYRELTKCEEFLNDVADKAISERKAELASLKDSEEREKERQNRSFSSYLDLLLEISETDPLFNPKQIRDELNTVIFAGHETLTTALGICLLMIGAHPKVQDALHAEMKDIFGDSKRPVSRDDLSSMRYCEAVINETLRLYPSVPVVIRSAHKDLELKSCTIPKDTMVFINIWASGRSKKAWGLDADLFRPERWFEGSVDTEYFVPFSSGKRTCIGKQYAMSYMKTAVADCVRELVLEADITNLRLASQLTLKPSSGHFIRVRARH